MKFVLLTVRSSKPAWVKTGVEDYLKKISPLQNIDIHEVENANASRADATRKLRDESERLLAQIKDDDFVILFDERGKSLNSMEFSKRINQIQLSGKKRAIFVIGGAYGVSDEIKSRADLTMLLAPFVLNHWIAQLVALEQIFRGLSILKGLPYHNS